MLRLIGPRTLQGLAFPDISSIGALNPFFNMVSQNLLDAPMFSIYLNPNSSASDAGTLIFGGSDSSLYTGALRSYPVLGPSCASTPVWILHASMQLIWTGALHVETALSEPLPDMQCNSFHDTI